MSERKSKGPTIQLHPLKFISYSKCRQVLILGESKLHRTLSRTAVSRAKASLNVTYAVQAYSPNLLPATNNSIILTLQFVHMCR